MMRTLKDIKFKNSRRFSLTIWYMRFVSRRTFMLHLWLTVSSEQWLHTGFYLLSDHPDESRGGITGGWDHVLRMNTRNATVDPELYGPWPQSS